MYSLGPLQFAEGFHIICLVPTLHEGDFHFVQEETEAQVQWHSGVVEPGLQHWWEDRWTETPGDIQEWYQDS